MSDLSFFFRRAQCPSLRHKIYKEQRGNKTPFPIPTLFSSRPPNPLRFNHLRFRWTAIIRTLHAHVQHTGKNECAHISCTGTTFKIIWAFKRDTQTDLLPGKQRAPLAFKNSMTHGLLQFALRIAFCCVLHRYGSQDILRHEFYKIFVFHFCTSGKLGNNPWGLPKNVAKMRKWCFMMIKKKNGGVKSWEIWLEILAKQSFPSF